MLANITNNSPITKVYFDFYEGVHHHLSSENQWLVRFNVEGEFIQPYYCNGNIYEVIAEACAENGDVAFEVLNSFYTSQTPSKYVVISRHSQKIITEEYKTQQGELLGYKRDSKWIFQRYFNAKTLSSVHFDVLNNHWNIIYRKQRFELRYDGVYFKVHKGSSMTSNGTTTVLGKKLPYDYAVGTVTPIITEMSATKNKGMYADLIRELIKISNAGKDSII